jgi:hypothetical protein
MKNRVDATQDSATQDNVDAIQNNAGTTQKHADTTQKRTDTTSNTPAKRAQQNQAKESTVAKRIRQEIPRDVRDTEKGSKSPMAKRTFLEIPRDVRDTEKGSKSLMAKRTLLEIPRDMEDSSSLSSKNSSGGETTDDEKEGQADNLQIDRSLIR